MNFYWVNFGRYALCDVTYTWVKNGKEEKSSLGKSVLQMWSQICGKKAFVSTKLLLEKNLKTKKKQKKNIKAFIIFGRL